MTRLTPSPTLSNQQSQQNQQATAAELIQLYQYDVINERGYHYAKATCLPTLQWRQWIFRLCLGLGTALLLLGIIFFFAYNWQAMPKWSKLALIEGAMVLSFGTAMLLGTRKLLGQCLVLAGTVFIGVFFAVFGQIYQTGADAWQLFALWAVLMLGFLWLSQFYAQWILQWSITGLALILWLYQTLPSGFRDEWIPLGIAAIYTLAVWRLQLRLSKNKDWLNIQWLRSLTLFFAHFLLIVTSVFALFDDELIILLLALVIAVGVLRWHYQKKFDLLSQVISTTTIAILVWALVLYLMLSPWGWRNDIDMTAIMLIVTIGLSVGLYQAVVALKKHHLVKEN